MNDVSMSRVQAERLIASTYSCSPTVSQEVRASIPKLCTLTHLPLRKSVMSSSELYLQRSGLQFFINDLVCQLQDEQPNQPALFIANYFNAVVEGTNVKDRQFNYINGCLQNRIAFLAQLQRSYAMIDHSMELCVGDFTEMLQCQCRDLPTQLISQATCHISEDEDGQQRASLRKLMTLFSACFIFNDFLNKAHDIYEEVEKKANCHSQRENIAADLVMAKLRVVAQQNVLTIPPTVEMEHIAVRSLSFKEFCYSFYESVIIADYILELQLAFQRLATA